MTQLIVRSGDLLKFAQLNMYYAGMPQFLKPRVYIKPTFVVPKIYLTIASSSALLLLLLLFMLLSHCNDCRECDLSCIFCLSSYLLKMRSIFFPLLLFLLHAGDHDHETERCSKLTA